MGNIELVFIGEDYLNRKVYTTKKGTLVVQVDGGLYTKCNNEFEGEPNNKLKAEAYLIVNEFSN